MAIGGAATCAKIILLVVNIIFALSGLLLIAIGIWLLADPSITRLVNFVVAEQSTLFKASAGLLIAMGAVVVIVSVLGFVAAIKESGLLLTIYIVLLAVVFCGEIAAGIIAIAYQAKITEQVSSSMTKSLRNAMNYNTSSDPYYSLGTDGKCKSSATGALWDYVQVFFDCCGVGSYALSGYENAGISLPSICPSLHLNANKPLTCCQPYDANQQPIDTTDQASYISKFDCSRIVSYGCADAMVAWVRKYAPVLIGIGLGIGMLEMLVAIFALCLCQHRNKGDQF